MKMNSFMNIIKKVDPEYMDEEIETTGWLDTGSYALNALVSGSMYKGVPNNRATMFAGKESTGKTFFVLSIVKKFMDENLHGAVVYFDSEYAVDKKLATDRGIDLERFQILRPETVEEFATKALQIVDLYRKEEDQHPLMFALDSLGNLSTIKETTDTLKGNDKADMTRAKRTRGTFRTLTNSLGKEHIPLLIANHTYAAMDQYKPDVIAGGGGPLYSVSTIVTINKKPDKDENDDVIGVLLTAKTFKSRFTSFPKEVDLRLNHKTGLDRYYGLLDLASKHDIFKKDASKKDSTKYELPDGSKHFKKAIDKNQEKYFTKEILERLEEAAKKEYEVGNG